MVAANFPAALQFTLKEEGGNDNDPNDHGGRTSRGIIQREWNAWLASHPGNTWPADVWQAPQDQINAIYRQQYWDPYCDRFPAGLDAAFFDFCVNAGRQQAVKTLQKALGVAVDGMMGVITWTAVNTRNTRDVVQAFSEKREDFYRALAQFPRYGKGWLARTDRCEAFCVKMTTGSPVPIPPPTPIPPQIPSGESPKANPQDPKKPPINPQAGTGVSGILALMAKFQDAIQGITGIPHADYVLYGLAVAILALSLYGILHNQKVQAQIG